MLLEIRVLRSIWQTLLNKVSFLYLQNLPGP